MNLVIWCIDGQGYVHAWPGSIATIDGGCIHVRETDGYKIIASYSLYNVIRWGVQ